MNVADFSFSLCGLTEFLSVSVADLPFLFVSLCLS